MYLLINIRARCSTNPLRTIRKVLGNFGFIFLFVPADQFPHSISYQSVCSFGIYTEREFFPKHLFSFAFYPTPHPSSLDHFSDIGLWTTAWPVPDCIFRFVYRFSWGDVDRFSWGDALNQSGTQALFKYKDYITWSFDGKQNRFGVCQYIDAGRCLAM